MHYSQTNPAVIVGAINRMQQQINALTEYVSRLSPGGGGSVNKMSFEIEFYIGGDDDAVYYSPLSLSERANLFSKITGREACVVGYTGLGGEEVVDYNATPDMVYRMNKPSVIYVDSKEFVGKWMLFYDNTTLSDGSSYNAGDVAVMNDGVMLITSELPGDNYIKATIYHFDFYA